MRRWRPRCVLLQCSSTPLTCGVGHFSSESHWPDGTPKRFRGKEAWKNWINWDAPFREESDAQLKHLEILCDWAFLHHRLYIAVCFVSFLDFPGDLQDELNRQRKFFWEVDDKGALWRIELQEAGRFGQMKHPKVVDEFFLHLQRNRTEEFQSFPFVSLKTHEHYYVRWANNIARVAREAPIVPWHTMAYREIREWEDVGSSWRPLRFVGCSLKTWRFLY
eukprot:Skav210924  [mRNA]  locus=scaffold978:10499:14224:- [translate_table: standard]